MTSSALSSSVLPPSTTDPTTSGIVYIGPAKDFAKAKDGRDAVNDILIGISIVTNSNPAATYPGFQGQGKSADWFWDRVSDSSDAFLLRICDYGNHAYKGTDDSWQKDNCVVKPIKYDHVYQAVDSKNNSIKVHTSDPSATSNFVSIQKINNYDTTGDSWQFYDNTSNGDHGNIDYSFATQSTLRADLWYCSQEPKFDKTQTPGKTVFDKNANDVLIHKFGNFCEGKAYYRVGAPIVFSMPSSLATLQQESTAGASAQNGGGGNSAAQNSQNLQPVSTSAGNLPVCSFGFGITETHFIGCLAQLTYYAIYTPLSWLAGFFGMLFDFFLGFSTSDASYRLGFVDTAWVIVRDFSNIFFIIILIYTGFSTVFNAGGASMKSVVPHLIMNALLINFSLLGTRMVIDLSNIVSRVFYNQIVVCDAKVDADHPCVKKTEGTGGYTPISEGIVSAFNPQNVFNNANFTASKEDKSASSKAVDTTFDANNKGILDQQTLSTDEYASYFIVISLFAAAIMLVLIKMFWTMGFLFLGRVVGLYVSMVFSPFAVLTRENMPLVGSLDGLNWKYWTKELSSYALMAPIFIFFLYVTYGIMQHQAEIVNITSISSTKNGFLGAVLGIGIPMSIIYLLISSGADIAKKYSGTIGGKIQGFVDKFTGGAGGIIGGGAALASGGLALAGSRFIGGGARMLNNTKLGKWAQDNAESNSMARYTNRLMGKAQTGSWDLRQTKLAGLAGKGFASQGLATQDKMTGALASFGKPIADTLGRKNILDFSKDNFKGGLKGQESRREKEVVEQRKKNIDYGYLSDDQAKAVMARRQSDKAEGAALNTYAEKNTVYKTNNTEIKSIKDKEKETVKILQAEQTKLKTQGNSMSDTDKKQSQDTINAQLASIKDGKEKLKDLQKKQEEELEKLKKEGTYKTDDAFKTAFKEEVKKQADDDKKRYGEVKTGNDLNKVKRNEYFEDQLQQNFWLKDGQPRWGKSRTLFGAGGGTTVGSTGGMLGLAYGLFGAGALGTLAAEGMNFEQRTMEKAFKGEIIGKNGNKTPVEKIKEALGAIEDKMDEHLFNHLKAVSEKNGLNLSDDAIKEQVKGLSEKDKDVKIKEYRAAMRVSYEKEKNDIAIYEKQLAMLPDLQRARDKAKASYDTASSGRFANPQTPPAEIQAAQDSFDAAERALTAVSSQYTQAEYETRLAANIVKEENINEVKNIFSERDKKQQALEIAKEKADAAENAKKKKEEEQSNKKEPAK